MMTFTFVAASYEIRGIRICSSQRTKWILCLSAANEGQEAQFYLIAFLLTHPSMQMILSQYLRALLSGRKMEQARLANTREVISMLQRQQGLENRAGFPVFMEGMYNKPPIHHYKSALINMFSRKQMVDMMGSIENPDVTLDENDAEARAFARTFSIIEHEPHVGEPEKSKASQVVFTMQDDTQMHIPVTEIAAADTDIPPVVPEVKFQRQSGLPNDASDSKPVAMEEFPSATMPQEQSKTQETSQSTLIEPKKISWIHK